MPKNTLSDLNNFLFGQLERLDNPDMTHEELDAEIKRTSAMTDVAEKVIKNANTVLEAEKLYSGKDGWVDPKRRPKMIEG
ncbi:hypothetical protein A5886_001840 [Enterococcus sp. 8G7_MSG3316]|uniref:Phage protein n=1 Tax=Candidatus Enterococcus testudinis TaxID=1834191 RepID=A0A242A7Q8_9ENTE|nr:hypothetical protein [Enterococcus sp. 8G7_MSG3316]OTN76761.1 hypothetical protein A5886_001840 [Enterococcus sp. 8G7_MSG3316]